jgi:enterochelin esterase family protein
MERDTGPSCEDGTLTFRYSDPERLLRGVRLRQEVGIPGDLLDFARQGREWVLTVPRPPIWRMEYHLELRHADGGVETVCDPGNPLRASGAFGDKSVLRCPGYAEPEWLTWDGPEETTRDFAVAAPALRADVQVHIWSPGTRTDKVVVAHDGPEYDRLASLTQYSAAMVRAGRVAPFHLVLLSPGDRNEWYSANPAYARTLTTTVLPRVRAELGTDRPVVGVGASLGALAMLHAHRRHPEFFAGLFLQSGSFFRPSYDGHESGFQRYLRLVRFVGRVVRATAGHPVPVAITCGRAEENRHNNREMAHALRRQGYPVTLAEVPDAHNFTAWRDALDPHLTDLLRRVWG